MRFPHLTAVAVAVVASLLLAFVVMFTVAVPRHSHSTAPITNDDWKILSNTRLTTWSVRVAEFPFGQQVRTPSEEDFRRLLKLLMPFEATTEVHSDHFDFELIYQGGKDPTHIYIDTRHDDMRFWINARPTVYRSQSRRGFLKVITLLANKSADA